MFEPIPSKYRPTTLEEFVGQNHLVGKGMPIQNFIESGNIPSMIFWGPPGTGKTTLASIISKSVNANFYKLSAVMAGKSKLLEIVKQAISENKDNKLFEPKKTILFLDEIHRWNKSQQDALLPYVEKGIVILIGATTENPSFSLNPALLSRARVFTFKKHTQEDVKKYLMYLVSKIENENKEFEYDVSVIDLIAKSADGDLRTSGNILETAIYLSSGKKIDKDTLKNALENFLQYEKTGEDHYNIISAVHKSLRDSDATAAVYWVVRMLQAGDDPLYIARRLLRFASEDIGNADSNAVVLANAVFDSCHKLGRPECDVFLIQLAEYLAKAPKSNSAYIALNLAQSDVNEFGSLPVPLNIRNGVTKLMKELGYGKGYKYAHDYKDAKVNQQHLPDELKNRDYFKSQDKPTDN